MVPPAPPPPLKGEPPAPTPPLAEIVRALPPAILFAKIKTAPPPLPPNPGVAPPDPPAPPKKMQFPRGQDELVPPTAEDDPPPTP